MTTSPTPLAWRRAFLRELARTGSVASAARACNVDATFPYQLRRRNPAFAASWDRALAAARERLSAGTACHPFVSSEVETPRAGLSSPAFGNASHHPLEANGEGGVPKKRPILRPNEMIRGSKTGQCRIVRVRQGRWSAKAEAIFLAELTATANVNAAARAAGVTPQCVYMRRKLWPAFAEQWRAAVAEGWDRIETLVVCAATTTLDPEPLPERAWEAPRMSMDQAIKIWLTHRAGGPGAHKRRLGGMPRREPDIEEVRADMLRKVAAMERAEEDSKEA